MNKIDLYSKLSDLKKVDYNNTLAIASIIEILVDKGIVNRNDIFKKSRILDTMTIDEIKSMKTK
ncbi:MAG: hypothetical protein ACTHVE_04095 [Senegalia sp. (in: firmicutes)]|uniref:hypothetical protein n=1 Tax=Senegalia sp. (in: firmicutes) TaxID=1924098 RepID=UPI003F97C704